jgi:hypothetical protein
VNKESIYDKRIAPLLLQAGQIAKDNEIDFIAVVDIGDDEDPYAIAATRTLGHSPQATIKLVNHASYSAGNVDKMIMGLIHEDKYESYGSVIITILSPMLCEKPIWNSPAGSAHIPDNVV